MSYKNDSDRDIVLVVEDEPLIRIAAVGAFEGAGWMVLEAANAAQAMMVMETSPEVALVFTDIQMPGDLDGIKLAREVAYRWPKTGVILTSGKLRPKSEEMPPGSRFLAKPYDPEALIRYANQFLL